MSFRCSVVLRGVSEGSFHAGSSLAGNKPTDLAQHQKARLFSPDAFKTSKFRNLPMYHFQKWLGFSIFCDFDTCHKEITIDSLIGSPCRLTMKQDDYVEQNFAQKRHLLRAESHSLTVEIMFRPKVDIAWVERMQTRYSLHPFQQRGMLDAKQLIRIKRRDSQWQIRN